MELCKFYLAKANVSILIAKYQSQMLKTSKQESVKKLAESKFDLEVIEEVLSELNNENILLRQNNQNMCLGMMIQEREMNELKAMNLEWEKKFNELIKSI